MTWIMSMVMCLGSITQKKYMRNEICLLISYFGAPSWFITFSPADNMHAISLYFADTQETLVKAKTENEHYRLIAENSSCLVLDSFILW